MYNIKYQIFLNSQTINFPINTKIDYLIIGGGNNHGGGGGTSGTNNGRYGIILPINAINNTGSGGSGGDSLCFFRIFNKWNE